MGKEIITIPQNSQVTLSPLNREQPPQTQPYNPLSLLGNLGNGVQLKNQIIEGATPPPAYYPPASTYPPSYQQHSSDNPNGVNEMPELVPDDVSSVLDNIHHKSGGSLALSNNKVLYQWDQVSTSTDNYPSLNSYGNTNYPLQFQSTPSASKTIPVATYPQTENIYGEYDFMVSFPPDTPKMIVKTSDSNKRCIYTKRKEPIIVTVKHTAGPSARLRFFVVFSSPGEVSTPVHPCKNDLNLIHPDHIIQLDRTQHSCYDTSPHPSVVVIPSQQHTVPLGGQGTYWAQLKIMCRNSCLSRKDLTLVCQLEKHSQVVGRESFDLKVSACPRRDAGPKFKTTLPMSYVTNPQWADKLTKEQTNLRYSMVSSQCSGNGGIIQAVNAPSYQRQNHPPFMDPETVFSTAMDEGRRMALLSFLEARFKDLHPQDYERAIRDFNGDWKNAMSRRPVE